MVFFLFNTFFFTKQPSTASQSKDTASQEQSLKNALENMAGVGEVELFFYTGTNEPQQSVLEKPSFTLFDQKKSEQTTIRSILVVATGADQAHIRLLLKEYLSAILFLPKHRIIVVPMDEKGVSK